MIRAVSPSSSTVRLIDSQQANIGSLFDRIVPLRRAQHLTVGLCSTAAPRACGLATFAADLQSALDESAPVHEVLLLVMENTATSPSASHDFSVIARIHDDDRSSYRPAANAANDTCDVVVVEHEFGIFGGDDGEHVLELLDGLRVPVILTLHTVLPSFSPHQRNVLRRACRLSTIVTVFTPTAKHLLIDQGIARAEQIEIVPHGAPDAIYSADRDEARKALGVEDKFVLSTFGLVSPGKGLELAIEALPAVVRLRPDTIFIIAGQTHPEVRRRDGESYRHGITELVRTHNVESHVRFVDEFLPIDSIAQLLAATDVFLTPYHNPDQIVSGALTFALAAGCPIVATPYQYANDQLSTGAGTVVSVRDSDAFAEAILQYEPQTAAAYRARIASTKVGSTMRWSAIGEQLAETCRRAMEIFAPVSIPQKAHTVTTRHLRRLVDDTGIIQHATGSVPLLDSGYCVDDVARLLPVALALAATEPGWEATASRAVSFLSHACDGSLMHNFMGWDRRWLDEPYFGDHVGRSFSALGSIVDDPRFEHVVRPILNRLLEGWPSESPLHTSAFALLGLAVPSTLTHRSDVRALATHLIDNLLCAYEQTATDDWRWFEQSLRYDNARLSQALIVAGSTFDNNEAVEVGLRSLEWYDVLCDRGGWYRFPGHLGLSCIEAIDLSGDEQPLEPLALLEAHVSAYRQSGDLSHLSHARRAADWFLGANRLGLSVTDNDGGGFDGLCSAAVNRNQGAESTLAGLAAALAANNTLHEPLHIVDKLPRTGEQLLPRALTKAPTVIHLAERSEPVVAERAGSFVGSRG